MRTLWEALWERYWIVLVELAFAVVRLLLTAWEALIERAHAGGS